MSISDHVSTFDQAKHLLTIVSQKRLEKEEFTALIESGLLSDLLEAHLQGVDRESFRKFLGLPPRDLQIIVDYSLSLEQMIAAGCYRFVRRSDITPKNFPMDGAGVVELKSQIIHFNRPISSKDAVKELEKIGLRPATIEELLAFGAAYSRARKMFTIVALGSSLKIFDNRNCPPAKYRNVVCLVRDMDAFKNTRSWDLDLQLWDGDWPKNIRFLAIPKEVNS